MSNIYYIIGIHNERNYLTGKRNTCWKVLVNISFDVVINDNLFWH